MTDTPGREPEGHEPEQRLPAVRPPDEVAPVDRFTSPPSIRRIEFTPERAAQVVRQSANARWVGFLALVVIILFISLYWFYELGTPGGLTTARQAMEIDAQQVARVERGYLHLRGELRALPRRGRRGRGGPDPQQPGEAVRPPQRGVHPERADRRWPLCLRQPELVQMPIWSDTGNPAGPLNYRQIEELIAFLLATNDQTYIVRDEHLLDPKMDPITGEVLTFTGWRDPNYKPAPGATPYPDCWTSTRSHRRRERVAWHVARRHAGSERRRSSRSRRARAVPSTRATATAPADEAFVIHFANDENGVPHNVQVKDSQRAGRRSGATSSPGVAEADYNVPALAAGDYPFVCSVHPNMTGTLTAE